MSEANDAFELARSAVLEGLVKAGPDLSVEEIGELLVTLEALRDDLKIVKTDLEFKFEKLMGETPILVVGKKKLSVSPAAPRKQWNHTGLKNLVMDRLTQLSIDPDTGELNLTPRDAVDKVLEFAHVDYWRATALQELDINPNMFCQLGEEKTTIRIEDQ